MKKLDNSIKMKPRTVRGRITKSASDTMRGISRTARSASDNARYLKRTTQVKPGETKPDNDAIDTAQETAETIASAAPRTLYRITRAQVNAIRRSLRKRREAQQGHRPAGTIPDSAEMPTGNHLSAEKVASNGPLPPSDPGGRSLSAREIAKARTSRKKLTLDTEAVPEQQIDLDLPGAVRDSGKPALHAIQKPNAQSTQTETPISPRIRVPQTTVQHERAAPVLPKRREVISRPKQVKTGHVVSRQTKQAVKTAQAAARRSAQQTAAAVKNQAAKKVTDVAAKNAAKAAAHMAEISRQAARRSIKALRLAARAALRAVAAASKALTAALLSGGWVVVVVILVLLMCASILVSPFGIFTHTDTNEFPDSITLDKAIATINEEYAAEIKRLRGSGDNVSVLIEGNLEGGVEPANWVDVLVVFSVHVTMREENAMDVVQLDKTKVDELRTVFWAMNQLAVSSETEDGETTTYIEGRCLTYKDMFEPYAFTDQQKQLAEELMSDQYYAFWSNFVSTSMGYDPDDWGGVESVPDDYEPGMSGGAMKIPRLYQFDYRKTVCRINGENKSVSTSGCGATSMSMVIRYLTGNKSQTPYTLFVWAYKNGHYSGDGLGHGAVSAMGKLHGVTGSWVGKSGDRIMKALTSGHPVIAHMGPGIFTRAGHYIVLRGVTKDGKILVNDPNSKSRSGKAFPLSTILKQAKTSTPFMICSRKSG